MHIYDEFSVFRLICAHKAVAYPENQRNTLLFLFYEA